MSQDILKQSLSALIDNEADELELRRVLNASHDPELRASWSRYHLARAVMHNENYSAQVDLSANIMAAIDKEPILQASETKKARKISWLGRVAVAASVTLAVLGGVRFYNQDILQQDIMLTQTEHRLPAMTPAASPVVLASHNASNTPLPVAQAATGQESWYERRLPSYLRQHAQQTSVNKSESGLPYARTASLEGQ
ncbi:RseA family anti-sigma factor [Denitrificimonas sp. JX-1]|uniref:RseA family anti-sigma factor n=1 Tax=Denitrificimonas halotolerans TaxID=3098930 RepID=A0ABU5GPP0_9GAMM|nr:RseA family anti-sigma factor [Denitrificimonas sp. JX-1]MDY7218946.1 RseA family anti-sigma factor [Denitrificimonas sp. JX-1]